MVEKLHFFRLFRFFMQSFAFFATKLQSGLQISPFILRRNAA